MSTDIRNESNPKIFLDIHDGKFMEFEMSIPLQILFDDVISFVSTTFDD